MKDQAESLRLRLQRRHGLKPKTKAIAVVSGKGGVGKSNFSLNFSISLSKRGLNVLLFDMDIGMGNLDILMGRSSERTIVDYLTGTSRITDIIMEGPEGVKFIGGGTGLGQLVNQDRLGTLSDDLDTFLEEYDYLIFDMGAGISQESLKFLLSVHEIIVITTPEPTALMDAYAIIKYLHLADAKLPFQLVANRTNSVQEGSATLNRLTKVVKRFLDMEPVWLGVLPDDRSVQQAVNRQIPFMTFNPKSKASLALEELVSRYIEGVGQIPANQSVSFVSRLKKFLFER
ncbi:MinD/ParA family protein [Bacillus sp. EB600]|nr:MinD/ParA family protein [Bacillus sp. EB600]